MAPSTPESPHRETPLFQADQRYVVSNDRNRCFGSSRVGWRSMSILAVILMLRRVRSTCLEAWERAPRLCPMLRDASLRDAPQHEVGVELQVTAVHAPARERSRGVREEWPSIEAGPRFGEILARREFVWGSPPPSPYDGAASPERLGRDMRGCGGIRDKWPERPMPSASEVSQDLETILGQS